MNGEARLFVKALSPRIAAKALATLDKSTGLVVITCWTVALVMLILAIMSVHTAIDARHEASDALRTEPALPVASAAPIAALEGRSIMERLQRQFPDIKFDMDTAQAITIKSDDGTKFHQWISALSYIDAMAPQLHWTIRDFCVGKCTGDLMKATVVGQHVTFALPAGK